MIRGMQRGRAESSADAGLIEWRRAAVRRARAPAGQQRRSPEPTQPKARRDDYGANAGDQGEAGKRRLTVLLSLVHPHSQAPRMAVFAGSATSLRSRLPECARLPRQSRRRMACRSAFAVAFEEAAMARAAMARALVALALAKARTSQCIKASSQWCRSAPETCMRAYEMPELVLKTF